MRGYFRNDEATSAVLRDGWFCSGDLAALSDENDVVICGRAKDTIVLRGGENVEPELIESELIRSPLIADVLIVGHTKKHLAALVVPDADALRARFPAFKATAPDGWARLPEVGQALHQEVGRLISAERGFRVFERVPKIVCLPHGFSVEDGTLTATMKKRRPAIEERFQGEIAALFDD